MKIGTKISKIKSEKQRKEKAVETMIKGIKPEKRIKKNMQTVTQANYQTTSEHRQERATLKGRPYARALEAIQMLESLKARYSIRTETLKRSTLWVMGAARTWEVHADANVK